MNHFTNTEVVHFEKDAGAAIKQVRRSQKVRTIHEIVRFEGRSGVRITGKREDSGQKFTRIRGEW